MLKRYCLFGVVLAALLTGWGCSDRGTNIAKYDAVERWGINPLANHVFDTLLALQIRNESQLLLSASYIPKEAFPAGGSKPIPSLILLAPEEQDKFYYFNHGLLDLLQEMTQSGEIQPMFVYCIGNDQVFGGYWYGNSAPGGYYDGIIAASDSGGLPFYVENIACPATINSASKRGIGGVGTASYGVFRALLKHPGVYSSVSVTDGPLDFDGDDGVSGLIPQFKTAMNEQYAFRRTGRENVKFDSLTPSPISRILLGGAFAFSPEDTAVSFQYTSTGPDTARKVKIILNSTITVNDTFTVVRNLVASGKSYHQFDPTMPFFIDADIHGGIPHLPGDIYAPIWGLWMRNNLDSLYDQAGATPLAGVNMFFATSAESPFNYYSMTQSWITTLEAKGLGAQITKQPFAGVNGVPAGEGAYLYDLLRKMLKFHSDNFGQ
jgi:hypothetical protein